MHNTVDNLLKWNLIRLVTFTLLFAIGTAGVTSLNEYLPAASRFLVDLSPRLMLICLGLGVFHYFVERTGLAVYLNRPKSFLHHMATVATTIGFIGVTKILIMIQPIAHKLTRKQKIMYLIIGSCSTGGFSILSLAVFGFPYWQLILACFALPIFAALVLACFMNTKEDGEYNLFSVLQGRTLFGFAKQYVFGAVALSMNVFIAIATFEILGKFITVSPEFTAPILNTMQWIFELMHFSPEMASNLSPLWLEKIAVTRNLAMLHSIDMGYYDLMSTGHQIVWLLFISAATGTSSILVSVLLIKNIFGQHAKPYLLLMPLTMISVFIINIVTVVIVSNILYVLNLL